MATGADVLSIAIGHIGERYENIVVPKDNADWHGPWDCAEFATWCVFQASNILYGCTNDNADPSVADAYSGAWFSDAHDKGEIITVGAAAATAGAVLIRKPPHSGAMGHIAISDGNGRTVEARGHAYGVCRAGITGRQWDTAVLVPGIDYAAQEPIHVEPPTRIFRIREPLMHGNDIRLIQERLVELGYHPGAADGFYGPHTAAAVQALQERFGLTPDGEVGPITFHVLFS